VGEQRRCKPLAAHVGPWRSGWPAAAGLKLLARSGWLGAAGRERLAGSGWLGAVGRERLAGSDWTGVEGQGAAGREW